MQDTSSKRKRYTPVACAECKRRKVKCDGQRPCHRCIQSRAECVYIQRSNDLWEDRHDSQIQAMSQQIEMLQEQVRQLVSQAKPPEPVQQLAAITPISEFVPAPGSHQMRTAQDELGLDEDAGNGHASSNFTFGLAGSPFARLGMQPRASVASTDQRNEPTTPAKSVTDPLLSIALPAALRLLNVYEEGCGSMYPFVDKDLLVNAAHQFFNMPELVQTSITPSGTYYQNTLSGGINDILKLVVAIAVVIENNGPTNFSAELLADVENKWNGRLCGPSVDILEIQAWTAMSILQFYCDEEGLAWRTIGMAARAAVEVGLHHREVYHAKFSTPNERLLAKKLFWSIYVLDRRWSFVIGLPFVINDDDIDPELPEPNEHDEVLSILVSYGRIQSQVWRYSTKLTPQTMVDEVAFTEFKIQRWQEALPRELSMASDHHDMFDGSSQNTTKLRALLYLSANQMRTLLLKRTLLSPRTIAANMTDAQKVVDIARDSVRVLDLLDRQSCIYASQQASFNYFLVSALAIFFLAACHANAIFGEVCRDEFMMAMDLVRKFSGKSYIGMKLSKSLEHFKAVGTKLGIFQNGSRGGTREIEDGNIATTQLNSTMPRPQRMIEQSAAFFSAVQNCRHDTPLDSLQLSKELTELFETLEPTYDSVQLNSGDSYWGFEFGVAGTSEDLSRSLMNLF